MDITRKIIDLSKTSSTDESVLAGYVNDIADTILSVLSKYGVTKEGTITGNASKYNDPGLTENIIKFYLNDVYIFYIVMYSSKIYICDPKELYSSAMYTQNFALDNIKLAYYESDGAILFDIFTSTDTNINYTHNYRYIIATMRDIEDSSISEKRFILLNNNQYHVRMSPTVLVNNSYPDLNIDSRVTQIVKVPFMVMNNYYIDEVFTMYTPIELVATDPNNIANNMRVAVLGSTSATLRWVH